MSFIKNKENFTCDNCGENVQGDGYTNHCPKCFWSKHVDTQPGDRASLCGGMMEAVGVEIKQGENVLVHRCIICGHKKRNKVEKTDDYDRVVQLSAKLAE